MKNINIQDEEKLFRYSIIYMSAIISFITYSREKNLSNPSSIPDIYFPTKTPFYEVATIGQSPQQILCFIYSAGQGSSYERARMNSLSQKCLIVPVSAVF